MRLRSTIGQKVWVSLTGSFLVLFAVVHLAGNLILLLPPAEARPTYNAYSALLVGNPAVKVISYALYASILGHAALSVRLALHNRAARGPVRYAHERPKETSPWTSRWMGTLGAILLAFLCIHMRTFWYEYHWGAIPADAAGNRDLYGVVVAAFARPWYVALYVGSMAALGLHLAHGVGSAGRTFGLHRAGAARALSRLGVAFAAVMALGFAALPLWMHFTTGGQS